MKKVLIATLGLSLLSSVALFGQDTATGGTDTNSMSGTSTKKHHHKKKSTATDTSATTGTATK